MCEYIFIHENPRAHTEDLSHPWGFHPCVHRPQSQQPATTTG